MFKNKKGFVMIETMVVLAFLATTLLNIYTSFSNVLDKTKKRLYYDDPIYMYRSYYLLNYMERNGVMEYIKEKFKNVSGSDVTPDIIEFGCYSNSTGTETEDDPGSQIVNNISASNPKFCQLMVSRFDIEHIYIMHYNVNKIIKCELNINDATCKRNTALRTFSSTAVDYLYTLDGYTRDADVEENKTIDDVYESGFRLVVEFKKEKKTDYTYYDYMQENYKSNPLTQTVTKSDYYYTTLEIPFGNDGKYHTEM